MASNWTDFVAGAVLQASQLNGVVDNFQDIAIFSDQKATNTAGGTFTSGAWQTRTLQTTVINNIASCSLAANVISLPAGSYRIQASAPAFSVEAHQIRFANTTDSIFYYGSNSRSPTANPDSDMNFSLLTTYVTITGTKSFELQHRCVSTRATDGFGTLTNFGVGTFCVYAQLEIQRVA